MHNGKTMRRKKERTEKKIFKIKIAENFPPN